VGYPAIPALGDTVRSLGVSGERFYALFRGRKPLGMISLRGSRGVVEICRLVVHPRYWRRGIASRLLEHAEGMASDAVLEVATAAANLPALALYRRLGYRENRRWATADGLWLVALRKACGPIQESG
jgi:ribosomal protein S18 acetylase RimI-like enzyme